MSTNVGVPAPKHEGEKVKLAGFEYVVPVLSFGPVRKNKELAALISELQALKVSDLSALDLPAAMKFLPIVHAAIARNYPELTLDKLEDDLDLKDVRSGEYAKGILAAFGVSQADLQTSAKPDTVGEAAAVTG